ncbi:hypothetical protein ACFL3H_09340 [Gemmatimonadota bacterium]
MDEARTPLINPQIDKADLEQFPVQRIP